MPPNPLATRDTIQGQISTNKDKVIVNRHDRTITAGTSAMATRHVAIGGSGFKGYKAASADMNHITATEVRRIEHTTTSEQWHDLVRAGLVRDRAG